MTPDGYMTLPHDATGLSVVFLSTMVFPYYDLLFFLVYFHSHYVWRFRVGTLFVVWLLASFLV